MLDKRNLFDPPIRNNIKTYENIKKIAPDQGDDYVSGFLLDPYFKEDYKLIAIDLSKQQALDGDPKAIQQINFTENLDQTESAIMFFILEEVKNTILDFSQGSVRVLWTCLMNFFCFDIISE